MKTHNLKLNIAYCDAVYSGEKPFEIRINDRGYQKGDFVVFDPKEGTYSVNHPIQDKKYEITYVLSYFGLIDADALKGKKIYSEERHEYVIPVFDIDNAPTVDAAPKWISVKDRLPDNKEDDWVLAIIQENNGYVWIPKVIEYRQNKNDWFCEELGWISRHKDIFFVTHWMPLPQPPKMDKEDGEE